MLSKTCGTIIETNDLTKKYGKFTALSQLTLGVPEGSIFGFLGPNGAGKSTTIKLLIGLTLPTSGSGTVCGYDIVRESVKVKSAVGVLPDPIGFYENLTARQTLNFFKQLRAAASQSGSQSFWDIEAILTQVGLKGWEDKKVGTFSKGMRQRLGLAQALMHRPKLLILDEPTSGLDPIGMNDLHLLLKWLNDELNVTIFLSTHILSTVEDLCDNVGIINKGKLVDCGTVEELKKRYETDSIQIVFLKTCGQSSSANEAGQTPMGN